MGEQLGWDLTKEYLCLLFLTGLSLTETAMLLVLSFYQPWKEARNNICLGVVICLMVSHFYMFSPLCLEITGTQRHSWPLTFWSDTGIEKSTNIV